MASSDPGSTPNMDITKLKSMLHGRMTLEECFEVALIAGLNAQFLQEITDSKDSVNLLIDKLHDSGRIQGSDFDLLIFLLDALHLSEVANLIKPSPGLYTPGSASEIETAVAGLRSTCICGKSSFEILTLSDDYESWIVGLRCDNIDCPAEWCLSTLNFENTSASPTVLREVPLRRIVDIFFLMVPYKLNLAKLSDEDVTDVSQLRRGDHVIFRRWWGMYDHHAILVELDSNKLKVIEWKSSWMDWKLCASISVENVDFPQGGVKRRIYRNNCPSDVVIARAFDMKTNSTRKYNLFTNNCETLAIYCKVGNGIMVSTQGKVLQEILPPGVRNVRNVGQCCRSLLTIKRVVSLTLVVFCAYIIFNFHAWGLT